MFKSLELLRANSALSVSKTPLALARRDFSLGTVRYCESEEGEEKRRKYDRPNRDRSRVYPVETSIQYLKSDAYYTTYGDNPVWLGYRRVHKGGLAPRLTRQSCVRFHVVTTASPCPICRDEYLVLDHRNLDLLRQFISPHTGQVRFPRSIPSALNHLSHLPPQVEPFSVTGLCQRQHRTLLIALERAYDLGWLTFEVPFKDYDYSLYRNQKKKNN